jgi:hypothetical protein
MVTGDLRVTNTEHAPVSHSTQQITRQTTNARHHEVKELDKIRRVFAVDEVQSFHGCGMKPQITNKHTWTQTTQRTVRSHFSVATG